MEHFSLQQIKSWDRFYRANFINCLSGFKPVSLIGSVNENNQPNLAIFSNIVHLGADPALVGFINRPLEAASHTISNIEAIGHYTINHIKKDFIAKAHQTSAKFDVTVNEFSIVGLTEEYKKDCKAPFVKESEVQYELKLEEIIPIKINNTFLVIGSIQNVYLDNKLIEEDGFIALDKAGNIVSAGIDAYYETNFIERLPYAKL